MQFIRILLLIVASGLVSLSVNAQQLPLLNQSHENHNPSAIAGDYFKYELPTQASIRYRYQWVSLEDAPRTLSSSFSHYNDDYNLLLGGNLLSDQTGPTSFTGLYGKAAYGIQFGKDWLASVGLTAGLVQYRIKGEELNFLEPGELANGTINKLFPDVGIGATVYFDNKYYLGVSIPQVFGLDLDFRTAQNDINIERIQHYYATLGTFVKLHSNSWLEPSLEVRYVENVPMLLTARLEYDYQEIFWVGLHGSTAKSFGTEIGVMWDAGYNLVRLGYSFTNFFQSYGSNFGTTHEIGVSVGW